MSDDGADARRHAETFQWAKDRSREALKARGYEPNALQLAFRGGFYDSSVVELAICDALVEQGGITAWPGDGVGCVAQMITAQAQRAEKAEAELDARRVAPVEPLEALLADLKGHLFPIMGGPAIPWSVIALHERQAQRNHSQTLQRLAERGGLSPDEAVAVLEDREWQPLDQRTAKARLLELVEQSWTTKAEAQRIAAPPEGTLAPLDDADFEAICRQVIDLNDHPNRKARILVWLKRWRAAAGVHPPQDDSRDDVRAAASTHGEVKMCPHCVRGIAVRRLDSPFHCRFCGGTGVMAPGCEPLGLRCVHPPQDQK